MSGEFSFVRRWARAAQRQTLGRKFVVPERRSMESKRFFESNS